MCDDRPDPSSPDDLGHLGLPKMRSWRILRACTGTRSRACPDAAVDIRSRPTIEMTAARDALRARKIAAMARAIRDEDGLKAMSWKADEMTRGKWRTAAAASQPSKRWRRERRRHPPGVPGPATALTATGTPSSCAADELWGADAPCRVDRGPAVTALLRQSRDTRKTRWPPPNGTATMRHLAPVGHPTERKPMKSTT